MRWSRCKVMSLKTHRTVPNPNNFSSTSIFSTIIKHFLNISPTINTLKTKTLTSQLQDQKFGEKEKKQLKCHPKFNHQSLPKDFSNQTRAPLIQGFGKRRGGEGRNFTYHPLLEASIILLHKSWLWVAWRKPLDTEHRWCAWGDKEWGRMV